MKVWNYIYKLIFFLTFVSRVWSAPVGWHNKVKIQGDVLSYSVSENPEAREKALYIVTAHLKKAWKRNQPTNINLKLHSFNSKSVKTSIITEIKLEPARVLFPINVSIGSYKKRVLIAWQETSIGKEAKTQINLIYSPDSHENFGNTWTLDDSQGSYTTILPKIKTDSRGNFHIFYQQESKEKKFNMLHSTGDGESFGSPSEIVEDVQDIGHGVFFPSIVIQGRRIDVFYQNRAGNLRKDEIFRVKSTNGGSSYDSPDRLTENKYNDFSPFASRVQGKLEWVWQGRIKGAWSIFYSDGEKAPVKITKVGTSSYSPSLTYIHSLGRIISWYDFRKSPPQIYSIFLDRKEHKKIGKPHNTSLEKRVAREPMLVKWNEAGYLFYLARGGLYSKKVDSDAGRIKVSSRTHPEKKPSQRTRGVFNLKVPKDPSGIEEIAWVQDTSPKSIPEVYNLSPLRREIRLDNLTGGNYYLHVRYKDEIGNESPTTHYNFIADTAKPSIPIISSRTHKDGIKSTSPNVVLNFKAEDDSAIARYNYVFSTNRAAKFQDYTEEENISFEALGPDTYFFKVRAVDLAGNFSDIGVYRIEIISPEDNFAFYTNIVSQQLKEDSFQLDYLPTDESKKIKTASYKISYKKTNPYKKGFAINPESTDQGQTVDHTHE